MKKRFMRLVFIYPELVATVLAIFLSVHAAKADKFSISGDTLLYNSELAETDDEQGINWDDSERLEKLLRENPDIKVLHLESLGGSVEAARHIADVVIDYELDTFVDGECSSSCVTVFLGGDRRKLARGSWLGFHKSYWGHESIKDYYDSNREENSWSDPFEFAEWLYEDTQVEILIDFEYMLERGVRPDFVIKTLKADSDDMWYPRRKELVAAGVLID